jgi:hypothetical protein
MTTVRHEDPLLWGARLTESAIATAEDFRLLVLRGANVASRSPNGKDAMSVGDKVWLVTVTTEPAEETEGNPSLTGYFLHASREGAANGLRDALAELGIEELIPELFESEFEEDGTYHGSFTIDDQLVSYTVGELTVGD